MAPNLTDMDIHQYLWEMNGRFAFLMLPAIIFLGILMVIGVPGNCLVLYIYLTKLKHNTTRSFVLALAVFDLVSCTIAIPGEIIDLVHNYTFGLQATCKLLRTVNSFSAFASGLILFVVAVDRYKKICVPLGKQISTRSANFILLICCLIALMLSLPASMLYGSRAVQTENPWINGSDCSTDDKYQGTVFPLVYNSVQFLFFIVGAIGLMVLYSLIGKRIWRHRKFESQGLKLRPSAKSSTSGSESSPVTTEAPGSPTWVPQCGDMPYKGAPNRRQKQTKRYSVIRFFFKSSASECTTTTTTTTTEEDPSSPSLPSSPSSPTWLIANGEKAFPFDNQDRCNASEKHPFGSLMTKNKASGSESSAMKDATECPTWPLASRRPRSRDRHRLTRKWSTKSVERRYSIVSGFSKRESGARRTTLMLFLITLVFILSFLPHLALMAAKAVDKHSLSGSADAAEVANNIILRSYFINSVANPIIYSLCCHKFRSETVKLIKCTSCRK